MPMAWSEFRTNDLHEMGCSSPAVKENYITSQYIFFFLQNETKLGKGKEFHNYVKEGCSILYYKFVK